MIFEIKIPSLWSERILNATTVSCFNVPYLTQLAQLAFGKWPRRTRIGKKHKGWGRSEFRHVFHFMTSCYPTSTGKFQRERERKISPSEWKIFGRAEGGQAIFVLHFYADAPGVDPGLFSHIKRFRFFADKDGRNLCTKSFYQPRRGFKRLTFKRLQML